MIKIENITYKYQENKLVLEDVSAEIPGGEIVLLCGKSGSGKTTFGRLINGLIPSYYEGELSGNVEILGKNTKELELYELTPYVGSVFQNPKSQFYTLHTDTEIVFACENMGVDREEILKRYRQTVTELHIEKLIGKSLFALSGGEKQKIACASVSTLSPKIIVLDEPTSNLDISTIKDLAEILLAWKKLGHTVVIAEHRLMWLKNIVDRVIYFESGKIIKDTSVQDFFANSQLNEMGLRGSEKFAPKNITAFSDEKFLEIKDFYYKTDGKKTLDIDMLKIPKGAVVAVLGNNGAGKTTFAKSLCGLLKKSSGVLTYNDKEYLRKQRMKLCYMVMQDVNHQLFAESVQDEVLIGLNFKTEEEASFAQNILERLGLWEQREEHPRALSGGQRQRVAICGAIATNKEIIIFDEPTSGLDYYHMKEASKNINKLSKEGKTQFIITHDPELVAECCDYFMFMESGKVIKSGEWNEENVDFAREYFAEY